MGKFGVFMNSKKLNTIAIWPVPESFQDIQVFLRFANFYHQFIEAFSKVALGFLDMLKSDTKAKFRDIKFVLTGKVFKSFNKLKHFFACAPMLVYYNLIYCIMLECNVSKFVILAILSQLIEETGQWHPIVF